MHCTDKSSPVSSKAFLDIQATIDFGLTLKRICDMIRTYSDILLFTFYFLSASWRIFHFHSVNSSVVILGFVDTICTMLESKPISISISLFQFIDIASRKLGPLLTSFLYLQFVIFLGSPVKTKSLCCWQLHSTMPLPHVISPIVSMEDAVSL